MKLRHLFVSSSKAVRVRLFLMIILIGCYMGSLRAASAFSDTTDLTTLSIEELMNIEVTSVSKKKEKISDAAAAVFVITQDDIRRSGATTIPDLLRMVPGIQVARMDANKWAVTSRGFCGRFANKLLVLIDGRSVYTPLFSGVFWEVQDTFLEDIDRIEVIRGPGAALWGANAVNGIINIITKNAKYTQGLLAYGGSGTEETGFGGFRYGAKIGSKGYCRAYIKYFDRSEGRGLHGEDTSDDWHMLRGGFRSDWNVSGSDSLTVQGDLYRGKAGQKVTLYSLYPPYKSTIDDDTDIAGGNLLARWRHRFSDVSDATLQLYYDKTEHDEELIGEHRNTFDLDFQHRFRPLKRHEIIWGVGFRKTWDDIHNTFSVAADPDARDDDLFSAFLQDEITLIENSLFFTIGTKLEHNDYTGFEFQPNARLLWKPHDNHTIWMSVSRAVRTPSRIEHDGKSNARVEPPFTASNPLPLPLVLGANDNKDFDSEELLSFELGYRFQFKEKFSFDISTYYNIYDNLRTTDPSQSDIKLSPVPHIFVPFQTGNKMDGETYGVEISTNWNPLNYWRLSLAYSFLDIQLHKDNDSTDPFAELPEGLSPEHQISLRSLLDIGKNLELDTWFRFVDELPAIDIPSYSTIDIRIGWKPIKGLELSITGRNLLDSHHPEYVPELFETQCTEIERSVYGKISLVF